MRTYYIFNVNRYFSYMYKNKPFKMYKMFEEIYYSKSYDSLNTYRNFETVAVPFNKIMLNEYIYYEFKLKYGYKRNGNNLYFRITGEYIPTETLCEQFVDEYNQWLKNIQFIKAHPETFK